jgi:hypothetical protein
LGPSEAEVGRLSGAERTMDECLKAMQLEGHAQPVMADGRSKMLEFGNVLSTDDVARLTLDQVVHEGDDLGGRVVGWEAGERWQ